MPFLNLGPQRKILYHMITKQEAAKIARDLRKLGFRFRPNDCKVQVADLVKRIKEFGSDDADAEYILKLCETVCGINGHIDPSDITGPL